MPSSGIYWRHFLTVTHDLSCQLRDSVKFIFKGRWLPNTCHFTIKMNILDHKLLNLKAGGCLTEVATDTGVTVYVFSVMQSETE